MKTLLLLLLVIINVSGAPSLVVSNLTGQTLVGSNIWDKTNVKYWGAYGTNGNDSIAVQACYNYAASQHGGVVFFPPGQYAYNLVIITNNISLVGSCKDSIFSTNNNHRPWNPANYIVQIGNDSGLVNGTRIENIGFDATGSPGAVYFAGGAYESVMQNCSALGGADTIRFYGGGTYPSTCNTIFGLIAWEGTNSTIRVTDQRIGAGYTTANSIIGGHINGYNTQGHGILLETNAVLGLTDVYLDFADNHSLLIVNSGTLQVKNVHFDTGGAGIAVEIYYSGAFSRRDITEFIQGNCDLGGTVRWSIITTTNDIALPATRVWGSFYYPQLSQPNIVTPLTLSTVVNPQTSVYQLDVSQSGQLIYSATDNTAVSLFLKNGTLNVSNAVGSTIGPIFHAGTNASNGLTVSSNGYVGIGKSNPANNLDITGGMEVSGTAYLPTIRFTTLSDLVGASANSSIASGGNSKYLAFSADTMLARLNNTGFGIGTTTPTNRLDVEGAVAIGASYSGSSTAPTDGLIVEGNVGIGTASPGVVPLKVVKAGALAIVDPVTVSLGATYGTNTAGKNLKLKLYDDGSSGADYGFGVRAGLFEITGVGDFGFFRNNVTTPVELVRITSIGNVGIGIVAPTNALDVNGNTSLRSNLWAFNLGTNGTVVSLLGRDSNSKIVETAISSVGGTGGIATNSGTGFNNTFTNAINVGVTKFDGSDQYYASNGVFAIDASLGIQISKAVSAMYIGNNVASIFLDVGNDVQGTMASYGVGPYGARFDLNSSTAGIGSTIASHTTADGYLAVREGLTMTPGVIDSGGYIMSVFETNNSFTVTSNICAVIVDTTSGGVLITLPTTAGVFDGQWFRIKNIGANTVTITNGNGSDKIDNALSSTLTAQYQSVDVVRKGTNYWKF